MMHMYTLLSQPWFLLALSLTNAALLLVQLVLFVNFTRQIRRWDVPAVGQPPTQGSTPAYAQEGDTPAYAEREETAAVEDSVEGTVDLQMKNNVLNLPSASFRERMESLISENLHNPDFTVDELAKELFVSRSGLFVKVKELTGSTPNHLIINARLEAAARLLRESGRPVGEICYMVGFSSPSYFAKCFSRRYGVTPNSFGRLPGPKNMP